MIKSILDTDILSEYLKGHDSSVAGYEIVYGLELKGASSQLQKILAWLNQNEQITPVDADFLAAATIRATARKQGAILDLPYCLIAAIAVRLGRPLVTGNIEDLRAIQKTGVGLSLENWRKENWRKENWRKENWRKENWRKENWRNVERL